MPRRLSVAILGMALWSIVGPAWAAQVQGQDQGAITVTDATPGNAGSVSAPSALAGPVRPLYAYWAIGWDGDHFCRVRRVTADPDIANGYSLALQHSFASVNADGSSADCPAVPGATAPAPPSPDTLARAFWDVRLLPAPTLTIVPGYAITGKPVYLQIGGERTKHFDVPDPLGPPVSIDATADYVVDWGDGSPLQTTTSPGGPWPHGDLTHTYTTLNRHQTIRVAQRWSATWSAGDQRGTLDNLRTDGALTFEVTQVQAVRN
jgi:hypothetical protein